MIRHAWIGALVLGMLPAFASAEHHRDGGHFSVGIGIGVRGGFYDYGRRYDNYCAPRAYYRTSWYDPAPVYCPPPAVVYEQPVVVYPSAPAVVYGAPPVTYSTTTVVTPAPRYVPSRSYYYGPTTYYYGR